jgi:hypothetical protein
MSTKKKAPAPWRSRIVGHGEEPPDQLLASPQNWRLHPQGQQEALAGVLGEVGFVQDVIVNKTTGHVVDGHLRVSLAISKGQPTVPVVYVELTEDEERKVLTTFDPIGAMAGADREMLDDLLQSVTTDDAGLRDALRGLAEDNGLLMGNEGDEDGMGGALPGHDEGQEEDDPEEQGEGPAKGELLALVGVTLDEPRHKPVPGEVWRLGPHVLCLDDVFTGWPRWTRLLREAGERAVFCPYPGPLAALGTRGEVEGAPLVLVQPDPYLAGHCLDRYADVHGDEAISRVVGVVR